MYVSIVVVYPFWLRTDKQIERRNTKKKNIQNLISLQEDEQGI